MLEAQTVKNDGIAIELLTIIIHQLPKPLHVQHNFINPTFNLI